MKIAVPAPLAGRHANLGLSIHTAVGIIVAEQNAAGGVAGLPIELKLVDDPCTSGRGDASLREIASDKSVDVVIGHPCGPSALAASVIYKAAGRLFLAVGGHPVRPAPGDVRLPSTRPWTEALATTVIAAARKTNSARIAVIRDRTRLNTAAASVIEPALTAAGLPPLSESITGGDRDFGPLVRKLAAGGVTHVVLLMFPVEAGFLLQAIAAQNATVAVFGPEQLGTADVAQIAGAAADQLRVMLPATLDSYMKRFPDVAAFAARMQSSGVAPTREAIEAAAMVQAYIEAARRARAAGHAAPDFFGRDGAPFPTLLGPLTFERNGDAALSHWVVHRWQGAALEPSIPE